MSLQKLILGDHIPGDASDRRKVILGAYLICIYIGIGLFFTIVNLFNVEGDSTTLFIGFVISIGCLYLLRKGFVNTAVIIHLLRTNIMAFYICLADTDPLHTGSYLYFLPSSLGALAIFGYRERWMGIGFSVFSFVLFCIAIFNPSRFHPSDAHFYLVVTFMIVLIIGILIVIFFDRLVMTTEKSILAKNEELIKTNRELDRFVYSASHDLCAPLRSLLGLIEVTQRTTNPEELEQCYALMKDRVHNMDDFIKEIIDFSRNARQAIKKEKVVILGLIRQTVDDLKFAEGMEQVYVRLDVPAEYHLTTDIARLRVVLHNLIGNAFKYCDPQKESQEIAIRVAAQADATCIEIEDNGVGIAPEHQDKIFDMFYRASEQSNGSGLGLYIVRETLARLNGSIQLKSVLGQGSTFTLWLPNHL